MSVEVFKAITPYFIFVISIIQVGMGFFMAYLLTKIDGLEKKRQEDTEKNYEKFVAAEAYYMKLGEQNKTTEEIFRQLSETNKNLNQFIGFNKAKEQHG